MDLLNLDELTELNRVIAIRGVEYGVVERSVGVLLDSIKVAKAAASKGKGKGQSEETFFENMIKTIQTIIPECPESVVRGLSMPQMLAVFEFANRDPQKMAEEALAAQEAKLNGEGVVESEVEAPKV
jgi:hypothetical protein